MITGRFAPSPTGTLHLGNLRTALASWLSARSQGGRWLIRLEDVDGPRCHRPLGEVQLRDLESLGLVSDEPVVWQSDRGPLFQEALERLHTAGRLYPCACTRKDLQLLAGAPHAEDGLRPYPGTCRPRQPGPAVPLTRTLAGQQSASQALRFHLPNGPVKWEDLLLGPQEDDPNDHTGDPLLHRRDGLYAYHLAVVVDDGEQGVTEVVRGADLRAVTATQIRLQEALALPRPAYAHLGLVMAPDGSRLGKRVGALGLEALAGCGLRIPDLLGWMAWSLGCLDRPEPCTAEDLIPLFAWSQVPSTGVRVPGAWT